METKTFFALIGFVDVVGLVMVQWTAIEMFGTLFVWHSPVTDEVPPELQAVSKAAGLSQALLKARRHRNIELAILGAIGVFVFGESNLASHEPLTTGMRSARDLSAVRTVLRRVHEWLVQQQLPAITGPLTESIGATTGMLTAGPWVVGKGYEQA